MDKASCLKNTRTPRKFIGFIITLFIVQACTSTTGPKLPEISARNILVLPTYVSHAELNSFQNSATEKFKKSLRQSGYNTIELSDALYQQVHDLALEKTGSVYDPKLGVFSPMNKSAYGKEMLYLLLSKKNFDLLVFPSIILRKADVDRYDGTAAFDGIVMELGFDDNIKDKVYPEMVRGLSLKLVGISRYKETMRPIYSGISLPFNNRTSRRWYESSFKN